MAQGRRSVILSEHFLAFIDRKVAEGRFRSRSEAICEGMRLLELQEIQIKENFKQLF
jgi:antitoxin ParD1/3/4